MKTILIIDDEKDIADIIAEAIKTAIPGVNCVTELDFAKGTTLANELAPDAIVLDLMEGSQSTNLPGQKTWAAVWQENFCPLVIYTGWEGDLQPPVPPNHPFVKIVKKGSGSQDQVIAQLTSFGPAVKAVRSLRAEVNAVIHQVLRDTAGAGVFSTADEVHLLHAGRRRIAASMDDPTITSQRELTSWEQYLVPAIGASPLTADLLRKRGAAWDDPKAYRLILAPSCDLVKGRCEPTFIVALCDGTTRLAKKLSLSLSANKVARDVETLISKALTIGAFAGFLPLPAFPSVIPIMVANLKELEVLPYEAIGRTDTGEPSYDRIASIDSPFREQVAWAYLTTAGRPGMPDRDLKSWAEEFVKAAAATAAPTGIAGNTAPEV